MLWHWYLYNSFSMYWMHERHRTLKLKVGKKSFRSETDDSFWSLFNFLLPTVFHFRIQHYHTKKKASSVSGVAYWTSVHQKPLLSALNLVFATVFDRWIIKTSFCELFLALESIILTLQFTSKGLSLSDQYIFKEFSLN